MRLAFCPRASPMARAPASPSGLWATLYVLYTCVYIYIYIIHACIYIYIYIYIYNLEGGQGPVGLQGLGQRAGAARPDAIALLVNALYVSHLIKTKQTNLYYSIVCYSIV